ncbi:MAG: hypothetical protein AB7K09_07685 [Planctomycetota bacterium]
MNQLKPGDSVRIRGNNIGYESGRTYIVVAVDTDGTFRARDAQTGRIGGWCQVSDAEPASCIGWEFLREHLPEEAVALLGAFDGVEGIRLRDEVKDRILLRVRGLDRLIVEEAAAAESEGQALRSANVEAGPPRKRPGLRAGYIATGDEKESRDLQAAVQDWLDEDQPTNAAG